MRDVVRDLLRSEEGQPLRLMGIVIGMLVYLALIAFLFRIVSADQIWAAVEPTGYLGVAVGVIYTLLQQQREAKKARVAADRDLALRLFEFTKPDLQELTAEIEKKLGLLNAERSAFYAQQFKDGSRTAYVPLLTAGRGMRMRGGFQSMRKAAEADADMSDPNGKAKRSKATAENALRRLLSRMEAFKGVFDKICNAAPEDELLRSVVQQTALGRVRVAIDVALAASDEEARRIGARIEPWEDDKVNEVEGQL